MPGSMEGQVKRMRNSNQKSRKGVPARYKENVLEEAPQRDCEVSDVFKTQLDKALGCLV